MRSQVAARPANIGLSGEALEGVGQILNRLLSDEYLLYTKTRNYHWNVTGLQFNDFHKFFEAQYERLNQIVDEVAERARSMGAWAMGCMREFLDNSRLQEQPGDYPDAREMIRRLLHDHEEVIRNLRSDVDTCADKYHDMGTNNFLTDLMERHEKMAWMLRAMLVDEPM